MGLGYDYDDSDEDEYDESGVSEVVVNRDIQFSRNANVKNLERHLLSTARFTGDEDAATEMIDTDEKPIEITPFITVRGVSWYEDVIIKGIYDEDFSSAVDSLLDERGSLKLMNQDLKKKIDRQMMDLKDNELFKSCILGKMKECCTKPRGYMDYIRGDISWDSNNKCVSCPDQDCLIYIYNFYYNFLLSVTDGVSVIDKLYILIICEARICILSKCLCLD